jgi:hypothetical protein
MFQSIGQTTWWPRDSLDGGMRIAAAQLAQPYAFPSIDAPCKKSLPVFPALSYSRMIASNICHPG